MFLPSPGVLNDVQFVNNADSSSTRSARQGTGSTVRGRDQLVANNSAVGYSAIMAGNSTVGDNGVGLAARNASPCSRLLGQFRGCENRGSLGPRCSRAQPYRIF